MAVETVEYMMSCYRNTSFASKLEATAIQEAASGLEIVEKLMKNLSNSQGLNHEIQSMEAVADAAVSKFKRCISLLDRSRTGHARFRRAPVLISNQNQNLEVDQGNSVTEPVQSIPPLPLYHPQTLNPVLIPEDENSNTQIVYCPVPVQQIPPPSLPLHYQQRHNMNPLGIVMERSNSINFSNSSSATNSFMSSLTGDTITSSRYNPSCSQMKEISHGTSIGKPPLPSLPVKRKSNSSENPDSPCHCPKKSKKNNKQRRTIRVPAISMKVADIPPDNYSWRKYGQKPIKGSSHPRGYYKCSSAKSCPARKHVERASDDSSMLIVTYEFEHNHDLSVGDASGLILESS